MKMKMLVLLALFLASCRVESQSITLPISARYQIAEKPYEAILTKNITLRTSEVALVLCDVWDMGSYVPESFKNIVAVLDLFRKQKSTIIHAPDLPAKYPVFVNKLKLEMSDLPPLTISANIPMMHWPTYRASKIKHEVDALYNHDIKIKGRVLPPPDIFRQIKLLQSEYVISTYEELRCVTYKHGITTLIYVGGAVDYCMLIRPYGILNLKSQFAPSNFVVIVLEDCVFGQEDDMGPYLRMYSRTGLALLSNSKRLMVVK